MPFHFQTFSMQICRGRITAFCFYPHLVVFLFLAGVKWVIKADKYKKIKFCCLQSRAAEPYLRLSGLDREDISRRFLFVEGYGSYYQASAGT